MINAAQLSIDGITYRARLIGQFVTVVTDDETRVTWDDLPAVQVVDEGETVTLILTYEAGWTHLQILQIWEKEA